MNLLEYIKLPKGEPLVPKVGDRFRPLESQDTGIKVGSTVFFYEVIEVKPNGYEVIFAYGKIIEKE
ncbi:hypothetical protein M0R04_16130 [Candidatus Dojkabacteria bacterium]|jgi:hypothetical protein|nr:hypothetical protein [Candidatus Dojkabacteria bacterium]